MQKLAKSLNFTFTQKFKSFQAKDLKIYPKTVPTPIKHGDTDF